MERVMRRLALVGAGALGGIAILSGGASPAQAEPGTLGWLRVTPATGTVGTPIDVLTQAQCPAGESIVVAIDGPKIPSKGDLGFIVGNTAITALPVTGTQQLYVPLSFTIRDWFGRNVPEAKPVGTYTITLTCRDRLRSSQTFGSYTARIAIAKDGSYQALGEASKPLGIQVGSADPLADGGIPTPVASGNPGSSSVAPSPSSASSTSPSSTPTPAAPAASGSPLQTAVPERIDPAAAPESAPAGSSPLPIVLLGAAAALVVAAVAVSRRRGAAAPRHSADAS